MNFIENRNNLYKFFFCSCAVLISLFTLTTMLDLDRKEKVSEVVTSTIEDKTEEYSIKVDYPRFNEDEITKIVTDYVYSYVKEFKANNGNRTLYITYDLNYIDNYVNIEFNIDNSKSNVKNHNILIDLNKNSVAYISNLYDKDYLQNEINDLVFHKYSKDIYELIREENINNYTYILKDNKIDVYINNLDFSTLNERVNISINLSLDAFEWDEQYYDENNKFVAFTFDDGPSEYTLDILKTLELNNCSATFFMLGSKMKGNEQIVEEIFNSNSEVASHTYSHKYLTKLDETNITSEINTTNIIFNEITSSNIEYIRPPYGSYNDSVLSLSPVPLVLWSLDTKDWLLRDSEKIYNNVLSTVKDGDIILMHDVYKETVEAVKIIIPALKDMGYEIVSVSNLINIKEYDITNNKVIRKIN